MTNKAPAVLKKKLAYHLSKCTFKPGGKQRKVVSSKLFVQLRSKDILGKYLPKFKSEMKNSVLIKNSTKTNHGHARCNIVAVKFHV